MSEQDLAAQLRQMGVEADANNDREYEPEVTDPGAAEQDDTQEGAEEGQSSATEKDADSSGTEADAKEKETKETEGKDGKEKTAEEKAAEDANLSPYEKAKRAGKEREAKAWQKIEETKAALKADQDKLAAEIRTREEAEAKARDERAANEPLRDKDGYSADDYARASKRFAEDGDTDMAEAAAEKAKHLRAEQGQSQQRALQSQWARTCNETCEAHPELQDQATPLSKAVKQLLADDPSYRSTPDGFARAVKHAKLGMEAGSVPELRRRVEELTKETKRLQGLTALPGSNPVNGRPRVEKGLDSMSPKDRERELRRMAAAADSE